MTEADPRLPLDEWEDEIRAFEAADRRRFPPAGAVLFVGSSTIRMWTTLAADMAPLPVLNRGFGGAHADQVLRYADRIVYPYRPRAVVVAVGENDVEAYTRKRPAVVLATFRQLAAAVGERLPAARLYLVSIKPSPARRGDWRRARAVNRGLAALAAEDGRRTYVDVVPAMVDRRARPRAELFLADGLHLSAAGYVVWTAVLRPPLMRDLGERRPPRARRDPARARLRPPRLRGGIDGR